jgi:preprotein translocase subunit SecA
MFGLSKVFSSETNKKVKELQPLVDQINGLESEFSGLSDESLKAKTLEFKAELAAGKTLDDILPKLSLRSEKHRSEPSASVILMFNLSVVLSCIKHGIAEMKTGEGKTLVATLPAYLNALERQRCSYCHGQRLSLTS